MAETAPKPMTVDEFLAWAAEQPSGRFELFQGEVIAMSPERNRHAEAKFEAAIALRAAIAAAGLPCKAWIDGPTVRIDESTAYEPDALVTCAPVDPDSVEIAEPVIIVEVQSPSSRNLDAAGKMADYFRLPSLRHYLLIDPERGAVIHHDRGADGRIATAILRDGALRLDPPGLTVAVADMLGAG